MAVERSEQPHSKDFKNLNGPARLRLAGVSVKVAGTET